jgi:hypothetical protein
MAGTDDVQSAVDALAAALRLPVLIEDERHQPLWWSAQGEVDGVRLRSILQRSVPPAAAALVARMRLAQADGPVRTPPVPEADMLARWCVPMRSGAGLLGYLWVLDADGLVTDADLPRIVACAELAADTLARAGASTSARERDRAALLTRLLDGPDAAAARELIALEGLDPGARIVVQAPAAARGWPLGTATSVHVDPRPRTVATSGTPVALIDLQVAVHRATVTQRVVSAGAHLVRPSWDDLGAWHLVAAAPADLGVADIHPGAEILLGLPRPDLLTTAQVVLDLGGDIAAAAAALHIHRTTLYYRLDRIQALTGVDVKGGPGHEDLQMALRLAAYRAAGPSR